MIDVQLTVNDSKDVWETIASNPTWQIILVLITAFTTAYFTHLFISRRNKANKRLEAISDLKRYGYELQQAISNRLQNEIFCNFYSALTRITTDKDYFEHQKIEVAKMPELSTQVSLAYGKVFKTISIIEQLTSRRELKKLSPYFKEIVDYSLPAIPEVKGDAQVEDILKYRDQCTSELALWIDHNIKRKVKKAYEKVAFKPSLFQKLHNILRHKLF